MNGPAGGAGATGAPVPRGGTLTLAYQTPPQSLDPAVAWEITGCSVLHAIVQGFFRYADARGAAGAALEPCLATEVPAIANGGVSSDGTTFTIRLREGVRFQPPVSRPVTAPDFKYSFERMMDPRRVPNAPATYFYTRVVGARAFRRGMARHIEGYEVVDDHTVRIRLEAPDVSFVNALAMDFCSVVPREWVESRGAGFAMHPLGTGPFSLASVAPGREVVLERNPDYWEPGRPALDGVRYLFAVSPSTALVMLRQGDVDVIGDSLSAGELATLRADSGWSGSIHSSPEIASMFVFMNARMAPFDDVRVRQAVAWTADQDKLAGALGGGATALRQFYPPGVPGHQPGRSFYRPDPDRARRLLADAGHARGISTMLYCDSVEPGPTVAATLREQLAEVGIRVELAILTPRSFGSLQTTPRAIGIGITGWWVDFPDPVNWIAPLATRGGISADGTNPSFWSDERVETLVETAQRTTDATARLRLFDEMQEVVMSEAPYVPLYAPVQTTVCSPAVGGFTLHPVHGIEPAELWRNA